MSYSQASLGNAACYIILFENQNICYQINDLENQLSLSLSLSLTHTHTDTHTHFVANLCPALL